MIFAVVKTHIKQQDRKIFSEEVPVRLEVQCNCKSGM